MQAHADHRAGPTGIVFDLATLRVPAALMLALGAVLSRFPGHPGIACPLRTFTGVPCPACGMTTSVESTMRFDLAEAWSANPMGIVAIVVAVVVLVVRRPLRIAVPMAAVLGVLAAMWVFQLHRFGFV